MSVVSRQAAAAVAPPQTLNAGVTPPTAFRLFASASLAAPRTNWTQIGIGTNSLTVPMSTLSGITNPPTGSLSLAWDASTSSMARGFYIYAGTNAGNYSLRWDAGRHTNINLTGLPPITNRFVATVYDSNRLESIPTPDLAAMPHVAIAPRTLFFYAIANTSTRLTITIQ